MIGFWKLGVIVGLFFIGLNSVDAQRPEGGKRGDDQGGKRGEPGDVRPPPDG